LENQGRESRSGLCFVFSNETLYIDFEAFWGAVLNYIYYAN
jgi:hypothetical protein